MIDYLVQNFNLLSFSLALSCFLIVAAAGRLVTAYAQLVVTRRRANAAKAKLNVLQQKMLAEMQGIRRSIKKAGGENG